MADDPFSSKDFDALLDDFITRQLADTEDALAEIDASSKKDTASFNDSPSAAEEADNSDVPLSSYAEEAPEVNNLAPEEKRLYNAYQEFISVIKRLAKSANLDKPTFCFSPLDITPRFSPRRTGNIKKDIVTCWDIMIAAEGEKLEPLPIDATDEQILDFAEKLSAPNLQLSLISYVETLIEIDACETAYNIRKVKYKKHKIEKQLYEEQQQIINKKRLYAQAIRERNFPVDGDLLVNNFFKAASKDPENATKILEKNPAIFAPIQIDKIPDRFFGLIKAKPSDGYAINRKLGKFLINLKV